MCRSGLGLGVGGPRFFGEPAGVANDANRQLCDAGLREGDELAGSEEIGFGELTLWRVPGAAGAPNSAQKRRATA